MVSKTTPGIPVSVNGIKTLRLVVHPDQRSCCQNFPAPAELPSHIVSIFQKAESLFLNDNCWLFFKYMVYRVHNFLYISVFI